MKKIIFIFVFSFLCFQFVSASCQGTSNLIFSDDCNTLKITHKSNGSVSNDLMKAISDLYYYVWNYTSDKNYFVPNRTAKEFLSFVSFATVNPGKIKLEQCEPRDAECRHISTTSCSCNCGESCTMWDYYQEIPAECGGTELSAICQASIGYLKTCADCPPSPPEDDDCSDGSCRNEGSGDSDARGGD